jgi:molybdate transport repressor ModE-like protein
MKLEPHIAWRSPGRDPFQLDSRLLRLLREIRSRATLRAATAAVGLSYRAAWDLLGAQARALGAPLVLMERGRGARLSPLAERLVTADEAAHAEIEPLRERLSLQIESVADAARLRLVASHDPLLAEFLAQAHLPVDLAFRGSLESIAAFARGEAELAGFHLLPGQAAAPAYGELIKPRRDRLIRLARREQGLIVAAGNPKRVRSLADVARKRLRFVNRQRGSGTRLLVDELLRQSGIAPDKVQGYADEEFTHAAVAATIAAGRTDAGIGVRAAAARFGLAFVPVHSETYWLLTRARTLADRRLERLIAALRGAAFRRLAEHLSGYDLAGTGEILPVSALQEGNG